MLPVHCLNAELPESESCRNVAEMLPGHCWGIAGAMPEDDRKIIYAGVSSPGRFQAMPRQILAPLSVWP